MPEPVFVQPHYDDIALSCGGTVARLAVSRSPVIVTICGGLPGEDLTAFARMQHDRWALESATVIAARRREDECAARALGESVRTLSLDYPDAIYRRAEYASEEALFGALANDDIGLVDGLADELDGLGEPFVMPLAVGSHVDHQLAYLAARELHHRGRQVWLYADLPYALEPGALDRRLAALELSDPSVCELSDTDFRRRWQAIQCYTSQLPVLFRALDDPRTHFEAFGREREDGPLVERFWRFGDDEETRA